MPELEIVSAFPRLETFVKKIKADRRADLAEEYRAEVLAPMWDRVVAGSPIEARGEPLFEMTFDDAGELAAGARRLDEAGIEEVITEVFQACVRRLSGPDTRVGIAPIDLNNRIVRDQMGGVLGWAPDAGRIVLLLIPGAVPDWLEWVRYTVAHEHHHSVWRHQHPDAGDLSLLEYLVFEGRADSFARLIVPGFRPPWVDALSLDEEVRAWEMMRPHLDDRDRERIFPLLFGGPDTPQWGGYTIGYRIVQRFLRRHPDLPVQVWTSLPAGELLEQSGYDPWEP